VRLSPRAYCIAILVITFSLFIFTIYSYIIPKVIWQYKLIIEEKTDGEIRIDIPSLPAFDERFNGTYPLKWQTYLALSALKKAIGEYPEALIKEESPNIILTGRLTLLNVEIGGSLQSNNWVLLATNYLYTWSDGKNLENIFHHEFSSLLIKKYDFPEKNWLSTLPKNFSYPNDELAELEAAKKFITNQKFFHDRGFVSDYGASSLENDVNTYAELLIGNPEKLSFLEEKFPIIKRKANILRAFYQKVAFTTGSKMNF